MLSLATAVGGFDTIQVLIQVLGHPFWFATPENEWRQLFWHHLPRWLTVDDMVVLEGYYRGESSFYTLTHIKGWARPVLGWTAFLTTMGFVMVCLNSLFRKQWTEHEKLTYPIIQLPIGMIKPADSGLFRSRILWLGFGIAGGLNMINSLHYIFPAVPEISFYAEITSLFDQKPWNAIGRVRLRLFPFAIGLAFFIPLDLSFSCWFFFLFWKGLIIGVQGISWSQAALRQLDRGLIEGERGAISMFEKSWNVDESWLDAMSHAALVRIHNSQGNSRAASKHAELLERLGGEDSVEAEWLAKIDSCIKRLSKPIFESE